MSKMETPADAAVTDSGKIKRSPGGTNPCRCIVRDPGRDTDGTLAFVRGCGAHTTLEFAMGHDAKMKSELIKAFRLGANIAILDGGILTTRSPMEWASDRGWEKFITPKAVRKSASATPPPEPTATESASKPQAPTPRTEKQDFAEELAANQAPVASKRSRSRRSAA